jgi:hypothetical protein
VKAQLRKQGVNPTKVRKKISFTVLTAGKIKPMDIALLPSARCFHHIMLYVSLL